MTDGTEMVDVLVFKDQEGELYALPTDLLPSFKVPAEHRAEAERAFEEEGDDEVSGHWWWTWQPPRRPVQLPAQPVYRPPTNNLWDGGRLIGDHGSGFHG